MKGCLKYKNYIGTINYSDKDEVLYGRIEGIKDIITYERKSVNELKKAFYQAVDDYLYLCSEIDKTPEKSYKGSFNVRITPELQKKVVYAAAEEGITLNKFIEESIKETLEKYEI